MAGAAFATACGSAVVSNPFVDAGPANADSGNFLLDMATPPDQASPPDQTLLVDMPEIDTSNPFQGDLAGPTDGGCGDAGCKDGGGKG